MKSEYVAETFQPGQRGPAGQNGRIIHIVDGARKRVGYWVPVRCDADGVHYGQVMTTYPTGTGQLCPDCIERLPKI